MSRDPGAFHYHSYTNYLSPVASGSYLTGGMVICPCSGSTLGTVAHASGGNLIHRAADVHLKERRRLILVPRETPLSIPQLENMRRACEAGAVVLPAAPGWYHGVKSLEDLVDFIVARILRSTLHPPFADAAVGRRLKGEAAGQSHGISRHKPTTIARVAGEPAANTGDDSLQSHAVRFAVRAAGGDARLDDACARRGSPFLSLAGSRGNPLLHGHGTERGDGVQSDRGSTNRCLQSANDESAPAGRCFVAAHGDPFHLQLRHGVHRFHILVLAQSAAVVWVGARAGVSLRVTAIPSDSRLWRTSGSARH